ncbi:prepilin peptidase [Fundicoccus sp. Sow4_F4]|uniref:prepilin peptidase n=2 Tax=unclassified Fundicoccus TaxID=2761543 RepID=UPI003F8F4312
MIITFFVFYSGCMVGSFLFCIAGLWTRGQFHLFARSKCDSCQSLLSWYELLPLVSYFIQRGKCRQCHKVLSPFYWLSELFTGCLFLHAFFHYDRLSGQHLFTCFLLLLMSYCDLCERWVPDTLQLCLLAWLLYQFNWQGQDTLLLLFNLALFGCFGLFFYIIRHDWIGGADIKLLLILELAIPIVQFPTFLFIAASLGILFWYGSVWWLNNQSKDLPFIPFISLSFYIVCLYL